MREQSEVVSVELPDPVTFGIWLVRGPRRSEIGLRRAVGYSRLEVARLIVLEAGGVGMLGGLLGTSIGVLATAAIASGNHWTPVMNTTLVLAAPFLGVAVGILAGCNPAIRAARITPMAALRS